MTKKILFFLLFFSFFTSCKNSNRVNILTNESYQYTKKEFHSDSLMSIKSIKNWEILTSLEFKYSYDEKLDEIIETPLFQEKISKLNNTNFEIEAYLFHIKKSQYDKNLIYFSYSPLNNNLCLGKTSAEIICVQTQYPLNEIKYGLCYKLKGLLKLNNNYKETPYLLEVANISIKTK